MSTHSNSNVTVVYRYSDGDTYTDYPTRQEALDAKKRQNGGTVVRLVTTAAKRDSKEGRQSDV